jgi:polyhydroxyalkanoate synthesis regulator phasin
VCYTGAMTAKETTLTELGEMLGLVVEHMATKEDLTAVKFELKSDIAALAEQVDGIENELKQIRRDLYDLMDKVENIAGYRKEIDHALERIAAIEKHLGLKRQTTA